MQLFISIYLALTITYLKNELYVQRCNCSNSTVTILLGITKQNKDKESKMIKLN